jgi:hypothetical protein
MEQHVAREQMPRGLRPYYGQGQAQASYPGHPLPSVFFGSALILRMPVYRTHVKERAEAAYTGTAEGGLIGSGHSDGPP